VFKICNFTYPRVFYNIIIIISKVNSVIFVFRVSFRSTHSTVNDNNNNNNNSDDNYKYNNDNYYIIITYINLRVYLYNWYLPCSKVFEWFSFIVTKLLILKTKLQLNGVHCALQCFFFLRLTTHKLVRTIIFKLYSHNVTSTQIFEYIIFLRDNHIDIHVFQF